jgi:hypothetical protein
VSAQTHVSKDASKDVPQSVGRYQALLEGKANGLSDVLVLDTATGEHWLIHGNEVVIPDSEVKTDPLGIRGGQSKHRVLVEGKDF